MFKFITHTHTHTFAYIPIHRLPLQGQMRNMRIHEKHEKLDLPVTIYPLEAFETYTMYM